MKRHRHVAMGGSRLHDRTDGPTVVRVGLGQHGLLLGPALMLEVKGDGSFELALEYADDHAVHNVALMWGEVLERHVEVHGLPSPLVDVTGPDGEFYVVPDRLPPTAEIRGRRQIEPPAREDGETGRLSVIDGFF